MRSITWALAALTALAACSSESATAPATAPIQRRPSFAVGTDCRNVTGSVVAYFVSDFEVEGTISGDIAGQAFATVQGATWKKNGSAEVKLMHRYVTADGEIHTSDTGMLRPIDEPIDGYYNWFHFDNKLTIVGGTGAFSGATGSMRASGLLNPAITPSTGYSPGGIQLTYMGRVCVPTALPMAVAP